MAKQWRGRVRSPIRRAPAAEAALIDRWSEADDNTLWSVLDAAWLTGLSPGTIAARIRTGELAVTFEADHGWRRLRTHDLRPLVERGGRFYGPDRQARAADVDR